MAVACWQALEENTVDDELECVQRLAKERSFRLLVLPGHALDDISSPTKASLAEGGTGSGRSFASRVQAIARMTKPRPAAKPSPKPQPARPYVS